MVSSIGSSQIEHFGRSIAFHKHPDKRNLIEKKLTYYKCTRFDAVFFLYFYFTMNFSRWIELWLIVKTIFTKNICCQTIVLERYLKQVIISLFRDWIANTHHPWHNINWRSGPVHKSINCLSVLIANQIANFHITINWKFFYFPMKLTKKKNAVINDKWLGVFGHMQQCCSSIYVFDVKIAYRHNA